MTSRHSNLPILLLQVTCSFDCVLGKEQPRSLEAGKTVNNTAPASFIATPRLSLNAQTCSCILHSSGTYTSTGQDCQAGGWVVMWGLAGGDKTPGMGVSPGCETGGMRMSDSQISPLSSTPFLGAKGEICPHPKFLVKD